MARPWSQAHDDDWMREECIKGTRLELKARMAAAATLASDVYREDRTAIEKAIRALETAKANFNRLADIYAKETARLASLADHSETVFSPNVTLKHIAQAVSLKYGIPLRDLRSGKRARTLVQARQEFFYLARTLTDRSYGEIGRWCGDRDHTTVIHGCNKHKQRLEAST